MRRSGNEEEEEEELQNKNHVQNKPICASRISIREIKAYLRQRQRRWPSAVARALTREVVIKNDRPSAGGRWPVGGMGSVP